MSQSPKEVIRAGIARRYAAERRFKLFGLCSILVGILFLLFLLGTTFSNGYTALQQTYVAFDVTLTEEDFGGEVTEESLSTGNYLGIIKRTLLETFPEVTKRKQKRELYKLVSSGAQYDLRDRVMADPGLVGQTTRFWMLADDEVDVYMKGRVDTSVDEIYRA